MAIHHAATSHEVLAHRVSHSWRHDVTSPRTLSRSTLPTKTFDEDKTAKKSRQKKRETEREKVREREKGKKKGTPAAGLFLVDVYLGTRLVVLFATS